MTDQDFGVSGDVPVLFYLAKSGALTDLQDGRVSSTATPLISQPWDPPQVSLLSSASHRESGAPLAVI